MNHPHSSTHELPRAAFVEQMSRWEAAQRENFRQVGAEFQRLNDIWRQPVFSCGWDRFDSFPGAPGAEPSVPAPTASWERVPPAEPRAKTRSTHSAASGSKPSLSRPTFGEVQTRSANAILSQTRVSDTVLRFYRLKSIFKFPALIDFLPTSTSTNLGLADTAQNAPLRQYEEDLIGLLIQIDEIESYKDREVRKARKDAVNTINKELARIDAMKLEIWRTQFTPFLSEPVPQPAADASFNGRVQEPCVGRGTELDGSAISPEFVCFHESSGPGEKVSGRP